MSTLYHDNPQHQAETSPSRKKRPGGRSARANAAVCAATLQLLVENGFAGLNITEVAARSGVHATSIYRRWGNKMNLALAALLGSAEGHLPIPDTGSLRADLVQLLGEVRQYHQSPLGHALVTVNASLAQYESTAELQDARLLYWQARLARVDEIYRRAIKRGELREDVDTWFITQVLIAPFFFRLLITGEALDERLPERVVDLVLSGLIVQT